MARGRVVSAASSTAAETFSYDGLNRRITITSSGVTTNLYYWGRKGDAALFDKR